MVQELNDFCAEVEFDELMAVMKHPVTPKYHGWSMLEVMRGQRRERHQEGLPDDGERICTMVGNHN
ncbi:hypothetical protein [Xanthobacter versatilis]|uniref:hypothetical protein n=1 Tax=Xanthobacter autotrophicus (strain ATCC BAA-1158 / Py2) TaxID=78245 RepID=UPI0037266886